VRVAIALADPGTPRATFSLWYVRVGDAVVKGDRVAEVLIPGATIDVHAPATGTLAEQLTFPNDSLAAGQTLGWIEEEEPQRSEDRGQKSES
jgi:pyruvate/2-oxoglutarate dehydrogenase complex dihydrolipoamide acyltransferase (E2) component